MRNRTSPKKPERTSSHGLQPSASSRDFPTSPNERRVISREEDGGSESELEHVSTKEEIVQTEDDMEVLTPPSNLKRPWTQYRRIIFVLGCLLGLLVAWVFQSPDLQLESLLESVDMADFFDDLKSALPSALPIGIVREAREIQEHSRQAAGTGAFSIGEQMAREGMRANYPVVMVRTYHGKPFENN